MSGTTVNITVNANTSQATAQLRALYAQVDALTNGFTASVAAMQNFNSSLNNLSSSATAAASALGSITNSAGNATNGLNRVGHAGTGLVRELMVIGHEAMSGRFSRIPSSLIVMAEYMGNVSLATMGLVGALAAAALGAAHLFEWMQRIKAAQGADEASASYFNPQLDQTAIDKMEAKFSELKGVSTEMSGAVVRAYASMAGDSIPLMQGLINVTQTYAQATGEALPAAANKLKDAFEAPATAGRELYVSLVQNTKDAQASIAKFDQMTGDTGAIERRKMMLEALYDADTRARGTASNRPVSETPVSAPNQDLSAGSAMITARAGRAQTQPIGEQADAQAAMARAQQERDAIANMSNVDETQKGSDKPSWFEKQQEGAEELRTKIMGTATSYKEGMEAAQTAVAAYWKNATQQAQAGSKDQLRAHEEYLRAVDAGDKSSLTDMATNTKAEFTSKLDALNAEQAANAQNHDKVMEIEAQKLALYESYDQTHTAEYGAELTRQAELKARYDQQMAESTVKSLKEQEAANKTAFSEQEKVLAQEVSAHQISKSDEYDQLIQFATDQSTVLQQSLSDAMSKMDAESKAYKQMADLKLSVANQLAAQLNSIHLKEQADAIKTANNEEKSFTEAYDQIGSTAESEMNDLIKGTTSWQAAFLHVLGSVIISFADMAAKQLATWTATELTKDAISQTAQNTRNAVQAAQAAGGTGISTMLGSWTQMEAQKTTATVAGNTARTASDTAAAATQTAVQTSAATAGRAVETATNTASVQGSAAKAAAGAYSAVAGIPYVGPFLAPAAAGVAYAAVMAYDSLASLDVGAWNVPQDMVAQIHKNEMVVPATFAQGMRDGSFSGGGQGGTSISYSPTINNPGTSESGTSNSSLDSLLHRSQRQLMSHLWDVTRNGSLAVRSRI